MTPPNDSTSTPERPLRSISPTRRSVIRGAAWTTPAILLATAAPAHAVSDAGSVGTLQIRREGSLENGTAEGGLFQHDVINNSAVTANQLQATLTISAADAGSWGRAPTAEATSWVLTGVGGTGQTRTFSFRAGAGVPAYGTIYFDVFVTSGNGNLRSGARGATASDSTSKTAYGPETFTSSAPRRGAPSARRR